MFITSIYCCHVPASSVPAVTKFAKTAAIPATIPVPTNAGIIGTKILEMSFNTDLILDGFCFDFCAAFISCARSFTRSFPDAEELAVVALAEGSFSPNFTPAKSTISCATLFTFPGPMMTWSCSSSTTPSTPGIAFNSETFTRSSLMTFIRTRVMQWTMLSTLPIPPAP